MTDGHSALAPASVGDDPDRRRTLAAVRDAIGLSYDVVLQAPEQLAGQLLGRLLDRHEPAIRALLEGAARRPGGAWMRPLTASLTRPGGALLLTLPAQSQPVGGVAVTPDGRRGVSVSGNAAQRAWEFKLWNLETGAEIHAFTVSTYLITDLAITPDGSRLVASFGASSDPETANLVRVWDLESGAELLTLRGHEDAVLAVDPLPDNRHLLSASHDRTLRIWDLVTGAGRVLGTHDARIDALAVSSGGQWAASASSDGVVKVWDIGREAEIVRFRGECQAVAVAITPDGRRVVAGGGSWGTPECLPITVWNVPGAVEEKRLTGHEDGVTAIAVTADGALAISGSEDGSIRVWDLEQGDEVLALTSHTSAVTSLALSGDGRRLVSGGAITPWSSDNRMRVWNAAALDQPAAPAAHAEEVTAALVTPDGHAVTASRDLKVWDPTTGTELEAWPSREQLVDVLVATPDGRSVVAAVGGASPGRVPSENRLLRWDLAHGSEPASVGSHPSRVEGLAITPDGRLLLSAGGNQLRAWDMVRGGEVGKLRTEASGALVLTPDGRKAVVACGALVKMLDLESGRLAGSLPVRRGRVNALGMIPDGRHVVVASEEATGVWDLATGACAAQLKRSESAGILAVSPDGRHVVTASESTPVARDFDLRLYDLGTLDGRTLAAGALRGHTSFVSFLEFLPDGRFLISASVDGTVRIWEVVSLTNVATFTIGQPLPSCAVAGWPTTLIAGDQAGRVHALRIENLPLGPAVVTAWCQPQRGGLFGRSSGTGPPAARCPRCRAWSAGSTVVPGSIVACESCGMTLLLNPFVVAAPRPELAADAREPRR